MKDEDFLKKLTTERKIELVDTSKEISLSYDQKSRNTFRAAQILIEQNLLEEAISMIYYSMYNKAQSLLYKCGIKCENHNATIIILKEIFNIDNKNISYAKTERIDKQYYTNFKIDIEDLKKLIILAEQFIELIEAFSSKLTENSIKIYRKKITDIITK